MNKKRDDPQPIYELLNRDGSGTGIYRQRDCFTLDEQKHIREVKPDFDEPQTTKSAKSNK